MLKQLKIFLILFFIVVGFVFGQNTDKETDVRPTQIYMHNSFEKTLEAFRVKIINPDGSVISLDSAIILLNKINPLITIHQSNNNQNVTAETDTISLSLFNYIATLDVFAVNDTLQVSLDGFNYRRIFPYSGIVLRDIDVSAVTEIYIKRYGTAGTVVYDYSVIGR